MLTDEQIRKLRDRRLVAGQERDAVIAELCTRVLVAEARVKVLEDALDTIVASEQTGWIADLAREALERTTNAD